MQKIEFVLSETNAPEKGAKNTIELLEEGATIPFIARYRKERTGGLDEVVIMDIRDAAKKYDEIIARQQTILKAIEEQDRLDAPLRLKITSCFDTVRLEDIYLPYKLKRVTRGEKARKLGLEPLAKMIMSQRGGDPEEMAERFLKGDLTEIDDAIAGAKDIIAEWINENEHLRERLRSQFERHAVLTAKLVKGKEAAGEKYTDYFDHSENLQRCASHRFLAIQRAAREGILNLKARPDEESALETVSRFFVKGNDACSAVVEEACNDAYKRLLRPSLENEAISKAKDKADAEAIKVFSKNLRQLLLAPPIGQKRTLAIDPGFRTGCKVVCLDAQGNIEHNETIFPHPPQKEASKAKSKLAQLVQAYKIEAIAIGWQIFAGNA